MDKKSLKEKLLKGAKDRNCKVVTSTAFSEVSINKQKNQRNISSLKMSQNLINKDF